MSPSAIAQSDGIARGVLYAKADFLRRVRWGKHAWATAVAHGLKVRKVGARVFVSGDDFFDYVEEQDGAEGTPAA